MTWDVREKQVNRVVIYDQSFAHFVREYQLKGRSFRETSKRRDVGVRYSIDHRATKSWRERRLGFARRKKLFTMATKLEHVHFSKPIKLNIGGQCFTTSIDTLRKDAGSMLNAMFSGRFDTKPLEDGSYFIDRDGTHFLYILNYLRTGKLSAPDDARTRGELLTEADFYQVQGIVEELEPRSVGPFAESTIVSEEQGRTLKSWIEETRLTLLFRASRDGWAAADFHSCCDNKGPTVTIVKSGDYIFGGYADKPWDSKS